MSLPDNARVPEPAQNNSTPATTPVQVPETETTVPERPDLARWTTPELAEGANREHRLCLALSGKALEHAVGSGDYLNEVKRRLKHGEWGPWLAANFEGSARHARRYTYVARNTPNRTRVSDLSLRRGLAEAGSPVEPPKPPSGAAGQDGALDAENAGTGPARPDRDLANDVGVSEVQKPVEPEGGGRESGGGERSRVRRPAGTMIVRADAPVDGEALASALGEGRAAAMTREVAAAQGTEGNLERFRAFLDASARAATALDKPVSLTVLCSPDPGSGEALVRSISRPRPANSGRRKRSSADAVSDALKELTIAGAHKGSGNVSALPLAQGLTVSREILDLEHRLVLRRANLRVSIPVEGEAVSGLSSPIIVRDIEEPYRRAAKSGGGAVSLSSILEEDERGAHYETRGKLWIRSGSRSVEIPGIDPADAPHYERAPRSGGEGEGWYYEAGPLARAIRRVMPFVSKDEGRPQLRAIRMEGRGGGTRLVASDSYRIIKDDSLTSSSPDEDVNLNSGDLSLLLRLLRRAEPNARVAFSRIGPSIVVHGALVDGTTYELDSRPTTGTYPDVQRHLRKKGDLVRFGLPADAAVGAVEAALALVPSRGSDAVRLAIEFGEGAATISLEDDEAGSFRETMDALVPKDATVSKVCFDASILIDALKTYADDEWVWLGLAQAGKEQNGWTLQQVMLGDDVPMMPYRPSPAQLGQ